MFELLNALNGIVYIVLEAIWWIIIVQAVLSWLIAFNVINLSNQHVRNGVYALDRMTEPLYRPVRKFMPDLGALDLSPMVVLLAVIILQGPVRQNLFSLLMRAAA
ncbi:YggT family protein [Sphingobium sp. CAP-1]|uniref:YggT family protein n=1 Tax=Sphingobium sp. CAP-1 TaxID=2676077 RepID=UPI0012BB3684|nr:YggT family protein [Sphingobium sp. CAP-1]QGP79063.1 YggT family protein [Sphingobium sp. CAP-1]